MPEFKIAATGEVAPGRGKSFRAGDRQIALFNVGGKLYAIDDACPHMRADLSCGVLRERTVICGWHGWEFELETGNCLNVEWAKVRTYPVEVRDGSLFVRVEPPPAPAAEDDADDEPPKLIWKK